MANIGEEGLGSPDLEIGPAQPRHIRVHIGRTAFCYFVAAAASIGYGVGILLLFSGGHGLVSSTAAILAGIVAAAMLPRFLGYYRTFRTHGPTIARATFVYGVAATTFFALAMTGAHAASGSFSTRDVVLVVLGYVALGPVFILEGAALIVLRRFTFSPSIALIAGVLFIVGGSFVASIFLSIYGGFFVLAPALMLGGIVLAKTPTP